MLFHSFGSHHTRLIGAQSLWTWTLKYGGLKRYKQKMNKELLRIFILLVRCPIVASGVCVCVCVRENMFWILWLFGNKAPAVFLLILHSNQFSFNFSLFFSALSLAVVNITSMNVHLYVCVCEYLLQNKLIKPNHFPFYLF